MKFSNLKLPNAEIIRAFTPIFLALMGGAIGIAVVYTKADLSGFGIATGAIAGAAGLAQPGKDLNPKGK